MNKCKICDFAYQKTRNPIQRSFYSYYFNAERRGYEFLLTFDEFSSFLGKSCNYCDKKFDKVRLDRVDNSKGYYMKNVVSCCRRCNSIKRGIPADFILRIAKALVAH